MNDGKFSASLITDESQIVFMDEWSPDSLSCEDAKRVLQGITFCTYFGGLGKEVGIQKAKKKN